MTYTPERLKMVLDRHAQWLEDDTVGNRAVFSMEDLRNADFEHADLRHMIFSNCDLRAANFGGANLQRANFTGSNVIAANFINADLHGTIFTGANLRGTYFGDTEVVQIGPLGSRKDYLVVKGFPDGTTEAMTGCFHGTLDDLLRSAELEHIGYPKALRQYRAAVFYCRTVLEATK